MRVLLLLPIMLIGCQASVNITQGSGEEADVLMIATEMANYEYEVEAGGFRSIIDVKGRDWVQFSRSDSAYYPASAASDYRGLPNLVFRSSDGGAGHPGFRKMTTEVISHNRVRSTSLSRKWSWTWSFFPEYAVMEIEQIDPETPYWFLYEGPTAGTFNPQTHIWGNDVDGPLTSAPDLVKGKETYGNWSTAYFSDKTYDITFFVHQVYPDSLTDMFSYMGNSSEGNQSLDGMTVFGFGREPNAKPLMHTKNTFLIGFYPSFIANESDHESLLQYIETLTQ